MFLLYLHYYWCGWTCSSRNQLNNHQQRRSDNGKSNWIWRCQ